MRPNSCLNSITKKPLQIALAFTFLYGAILMAGLIRGDFSTIITLPALLIVMKIGYGEFIGNAGSHCISSTPLLFAIVAGCILLF